MSCLFSLLNLLYTEIKTSKTGCHVYYNRWIYYLNSSTRRCVRTWTYPEVSTTGSHKCLKKRLLYTRYTAHMLPITKQLSYTIPMLNTNSYYGYRDRCIRDIWSWATVEGAEAIYVPYIRAVHACRICFIAMITIASASNDPVIILDEN